MLREDVRRQHSEIHVHIDDTAAIGDRRRSLPVRAPPHELSSPLVARLPGDTYVPNVHDGAQAAARSQGTGMQDRSAARQQERPEMHREAEARLGESRGAPDASSRATGRAVAKPKAKARQPQRASPPANPWNHFQQVIGLTSDVASTAWSLARRGRRPEYIAYLRARHVSNVRIDHAYGIADY